MKKRILALLLLMSLIMTSCGSKETPEPTVTPTASQAESTQAAGNQTESTQAVGNQADYPYGTFDMDALCKNIRLNGKLITFPCTIGDLGEDYTIPEIKENFSTTGVMFDLYYKTGESFLIEVDEEKIEDVNLDSMIKSIDVYINDKIELEILGIEIGKKITEEKLRETFGRGSTEDVNVNKGTLSYWYRTEDYNSFSIYATNEICEIMRIIMIY